MKMHCPKEARRQLSRLKAGLPPLSRLHRQAARLGWLAAARREPERTCPVREEGFLRSFWLAGHRHFQAGIGPLPDEKPPLRKIR